MNMFVISFPGLNKHKILNNKPIPSGKFKNMDLRSALRSFEIAEISSLVLGSNDSRWLFSLPPDNALKEFFQLIRQLYDGTNFKVLFISTIFPRMEFYDHKGKLKPGIREFNEQLISAKGDSRYEIKIRNLENKIVTLKWRLVNMTDIFSYDKMCDPKMYCGVRQDGVHLKGIHAERYLELMNLTVKKI